MRTSTAGGLGDVVFFFFFVGAVDMFWVCAVFINYMAVTSSKKKKRRKVKEKRTSGFFSREVYLKEGNENGENLTLLFTSLYFFFFFVLGVVEAKTG